MTPTRTLYDKHIDSHTVCRLDDQGHVLLYIDRQVINEYTSPQAFSGLRDAGRSVWRPETALAVVDHVNPTAPKRIAAMSDAGAAGDSHTTTYGALGAFGFGIGTSEIEHLLASQTLVYKRLKTLRVTVDGELPGADRRDRRLRCDRLCHRVLRFDHRCAECRGAHDHLQHGGGSRCPGCLHGAG